MSEGTGEENMTSDPEHHPPEPIFVKEELGEEMEEGFEDEGVDYNNYHALKNKFSIIFISKISNSFTTFVFFI